MFQSRANPAILFLAASAYISKQRMVRTEHPSANMDMAGHALPRHVEKELRDFLKCGVRAHVSFVYAATTAADACWWDSRVRVADFDRVAPDGE
jgi:hypothetical protein